MGKFRTCSISIRENKQVFRAGELVNGYLMLDVLEPVTVKGIRIYCHGKALTKWPKAFSRDLWNKDQIGSETYYAQVITVFGKKLEEDGPHHTLPVGEHRWAFAFLLPAEMLPSSFEGEHGAIRWYLKVEVDKPFPSINNRWYRTFTVLSKLDMNEAVYQMPLSKTASKTVSKALGLGNAGTLTLSAKTDRLGYCPGESIVLTVDAKNESSKDMGKVRITLIQHVVFKANNETKSTSWGVSSKETKMSLAKDTTLSLTDLMMPIPAVPPSSRKRACHIITCTYSVKVTVHIPWGVNLDAVIPIIIGTIPRGKRLPPPLHSAAQAAANPATSIQYVECEVGITPCTKSHDDFPNFPSNTYTAFVPNYSPTVGATAATAVAPLAVAGAPRQLAQKPPLQKPAASLDSETAARAKAAEAASSVPAPSVVAGVVPPVRALIYSSLSGAPSQGKMELPSTYEDVLKETSSAHAVPKGKTRAVMLVRFPDTFLASFRDCIQREQNNLLDSEEAFLAVLSPQPITVLDGPNEMWPERVALAVLVFPDMRSGEDWLAGVSERGDNWYSCCDAVIIPANWSVPQNAGGRLILTLSLSKIREDAPKDGMMEFNKTIVPLIAKLRQDCGGRRQAASKEPKTQHSAQSWVTSDYTITLTYWPKVDNYFAYKDGLKKGEFSKLNEKFRALYDTYSILLISEDVTSLSIQPAVSLDDEERGGDGNDDNSTGDNSGETENLLEVDNNHFSD